MPLSVVYFLIGLLTIISVPLKFIPFLFYWELLSWGMSVGWFIILQERNPMPFNELKFIVWAVLVFLFGLAVNFVNIGWVVITGLFFFLWTILTFWDYFDGN
jgi:hypothetical protein